MKRIASDAVFCAGLALVGVGLWCAWQPAAWLFGGVVLCVATLLQATSRRRRHDR
jgi:hypothetical protein